MTFATEMGPWLAVGTFVLWGVVLWVEAFRSRAARGQLAAAADLSRLTSAVIPRRRSYGRALSLVGVSAVAFAVGRPQVQGQGEWSRRGIDLVIAMDVSKSMLAKDVYPSRLARVRAEVDDLLDSLGTDRVSIVPFAGAATHSPLSHDREAAKSFYRDLVPDDLPPGSNLADAVLVSRCLLREDLRSEPGCERIGGRGNGGAPLTGPRAEQKNVESSSERAPGPFRSGIEERGRVLVLFTDAEAQDGLPRAARELDRAVSLGISAFVVGVGTTNGDLIPELDRDGRQRGWKKGADGKLVTTRLDVDSLAQLAVAAGGLDRQYVVDPDRLGLPELIERLKGIKRGDLEKLVVRRPKDVYHWFLFPGFVLLCGESVLRSRRKLVRAKKGARP